MPTTMETVARMTFTQTFRAMNTTINIHIGAVAGDPQAVATADAVTAYFAEVEARLSRFRTDSELSALNRAGVLTDVSPLLFESVAAACRMAGRTGGIYDPTILPQLEQAGYDRTFEAIARGGYLYHSPAVILPRSDDYRAVTLDPRQRRIGLGVGQRIDLGGIAKGRTVDQAARLVRAAGFMDFVIEAGGDMYAGGDAPQGTGGWVVGVANPFAETNTVTDMRLRDRAVATSSIMGRRWQRDGQIAHHLIDPRTGKSAATDLVAVSAIAPTAEEADVLAKTVLILGSAAGRTFIETQPDCAALCVTATGTTFTTAHWPKEGHIA